MVLENTTKQDELLPNTQPLDTASGSSVKGTKTTTLSVDSSLPMRANSPNVSDPEAPAFFGNSVFRGGYMRSGNYLSGSAGWAIDADGNVEFNDGTFRGTFNIGGTTITIDNTQNIQTYLDLIESEGGGILYLQPGTYTLTADITIPSGVTLQGVSRDGVIINCNTSYAVKIAGTDVYTTGTVTINNGQTTLEGAGGMTWTDAMIGRYVLLDGLWYEITGRTDNDTLTIATYEGVNLAGATYVIADTNFSARLNDVTVTGATGSGVVVQYAMEPTLYNLFIYGCGTGIEMDYVTYPKIEVTSSGNGVNLDMNYVEGFIVDFSDLSNSTTGAGAVMNQSRNATFFNSSVTDCTGDGINMTSCSKIAFISFDISGNGGQGVEFVSGCDDNQFSEGIFDGNTSDNIKLTATSDRNTFVAITSKNAGGYGINIAAATCDGNVINSPVFSSNSSGNINDSGTLTVIIADDTAYGATWNGNLGVATKNTIYDKIEDILDGVTFTGDISVPDEAYGAGWDGSVEVPTKNAVYDKIQTISTSITYKNGTTTYDISTATGTQNIAHGVGTTPKKIKLTLYLSSAVYAFHVYNGTTNSGIYYNATTGVGAGTTTYIYTGANTGVTLTTTFDGTNIALAWTKEGSPTGTLYIMWEAEA